MFAGVEIGLAISVGLSLLIVVYESTYPQIPIGGRIGIGRTQRDTSALHPLDFMVENYKVRGQQICLCNPSLTVVERLVKSGLVDRVSL